MSLHLDWCSHKAALYAMRRWHYSRCMPASGTVKVGVWENKQFIGAVVFSLGAGPQLHRPYKLKRTEVCELTRIALDRHNTSVTKIVKIAFKFLRRKCPGIRLVVSYADPEQNHYGGIYQAGNWIYEGITKPTEHFIEVATGKTIHSKTARTGRRGLATQMIKRGILRPIKTWKFKYLMPFDKEMRQQIRGLSKPYPKRVRSVGSDTPADQAGEGSATLTRTL